MLCQFLNHMYHTARDYERLSTEKVIRLALQVRAFNNTLFFVFVSGNDIYFSPFKEYIGT